MALSHDIKSRFSEDLCFPNFYAVEILESIGIIDPSQEVIDEVEKCLIRSQTFSDLNLIRLKKIKYSNRFKVLLVENNPFFIISHSLLLTNIGFDVDVAYSNSDASLKSFSEYAAVFIRDAMPEINSGILMHLISELMPAWRKPAIFNICTHEQLSSVNKSYLKEMNCTAILNLPVMFSKLTEEVYKAGFFIGNSNREIAAC